MKMLIAILCWICLTCGSALSQTTVLRPGPTQPGSLDLWLRDVTAAEAKSYGWEAPTGAVVDDGQGIEPDETPLLEGDVITSVDGVEVGNRAALKAMVREKGAGIDIRVRVLRGGQTKTLTVKLVEDQHTPLNLMFESGGHTAWVKALAFTSDGKSLVSAGDDKVIRVWDLAKGRVERTIRGETGLGLNGMIYAMALSPAVQVNGAPKHRWLAVGGFLGGDSRDEPVRIYDFETGALVKLLVGHRDVVYGLAFSDDGRFLISGAGQLDKSAIVWDVSNWRKVVQLRGHTDIINRVALSADGATAFTASTDKTVRKWSVASGKWSIIATHQSDVYGLSVRQDGAVASADYDGTILLWTPSGGGKSKVLAKSSDKARSIEFSPDGKSLIVGSRASFGPWPIEVYDAATGKRVQSYDGHMNTSGGIAVSPDNKNVASSDFNGRIAIWPLRPVATQPGPTQADLQFSSSGRNNWSVAFSNDGHSIAWGTTSFNPTGITRDRNIRGPLQYWLQLPIDTVAMRQPERLAHAAAKDTGWRRALSQTEAVRVEIRKFKETEDTIAVQFQERVFEETRTVRNGFGHRSYTITPDQTAVISGGNNGRMDAYMVAPNFGKELGQYIGHEGNVWAVATSPDGRLLVSASADHTVRLWNLKTRELIVSLFVSYTPGGDIEDWVMWTPQGYFTSSANGEDLIGWQANRGQASVPDFYKASQLSSTFRREDIVKKAIVVGSAAEAVRTSNGTQFKLADLVKRPPPRVAILSPTASATLKDGFAEVRLRIDPTPDPMTRLSIRVNGIQTRELPVERTQGEIVRRVDLAQGDNTITVIAGNGIGDTTVEIRVRQDGKGVLDRRGKLYVVAIGVDRYPNLAPVCGDNEKSTCDLSYPGSDANSFADAVAKALGPFHEPNPDLTVLVNDAGKTGPTAGAVREALSRVQGLAEPQDTVVVYLAGHGVNYGNDYLFMTTDATRQGKGWNGSTVVPWVEIERIVFGTSGRRFLFVDTCHSAGAYNSGLGRAAAYNDVTAITAAGQDESSLEYPELKAGVFTYTIKSALGHDAAIADANRDGLVVVSELVDYIKRRSSELIDTIEPDYATKNKKPVPHLSRARDARDHVMVKLN